MMIRSSFRGFPFAIALATLCPAALQAQPGTALPAPAPLTGATLRTLQGEQDTVSNLRKADFVRAAHLPATLADADPTAWAAWFKAAKAAGFQQVIVPVLQGGSILLDPAHSLSARTNPGMARQDSQGRALSLLDRAAKEASAHGLKVWASLEIGSLDVGSPDALPANHPARTNPQLLRSNPTPGAVSPLIYDLGQAGNLKLFALIAAEVASYQGISGLVLGDLQAEHQPTPTLVSAVRKISTAARNVSPMMPVALRTTGGSLPWTPGAPLSALATQLQDGSIQHWIHAAAPDEPGEAATLQAVLNSPVPMTLEVSLHGGGTMSVVALQALQAVTDNRFSGLSVSSGQLQGLRTEDLLSFRNILDANAVEKKVATMASRAGSPLSIAPALSATPALNSIQSLTLPTAPKPNTEILAAPETTEAPITTLPSLDLGAASSAAPAPAPLSAETPADSPAPTTESAPSAADSETTAAAPTAQLNVENVPEPKAPPAPKTPDFVSVPNRPAPRVAPPWNGLRATNYATDEDINAFTDAPTRQPRPSSTVQFIKIDHGDTESPLAPPNRSREFIDYAGMARSSAVRTAQPLQTDAPILKLTTTTGRTFTGRASQQGSLWRVELPSGGVVSLPASRVTSAEPAAASN